jgi:hypothetical protein
MRPLDVRRRLVSALEADLIGPFAGGTPDVSPEEAWAASEILPLAPSRWYLTGFLAPAGGRSPEEGDIDSLGGEAAAGNQSQADDAGSEEPEPKRTVRFPASMGLSVYLPPPPRGEADVLEADVSFAYYDVIEVATDKEERKSKAWKRVPVGPITVRVPLREDALRQGVPVGRNQLVIRGELRTTSIEGLPAGSRVASLFVVNEQPALDKDRDLAFVFQVRLVLRYAPGFAWRPNRRGEDAKADDDPRVLALLFRDRKEWAVGHNTSVAMPVPDADGVVRALGTTQLPSYVVPEVEQGKIENLGLVMSDLGKLEDGRSLARTLSPLVESYAQWLEGQRRARLDRAALEETRDTLVAKADKIRARIAEGIALLERDATVREAFVLANRAMHAAAVQSDRARAEKRYVGTRKPEWRPFQLAFVLMNLAGIADPAHADRVVADLIYFPTGGGKTEAYLGLIAVTLLLRRLRGKSRPDEGRGVAVVLRYTLRLLTLDQLQRASALICALEEVRLKSPGKLGNTRFTVGLWVGRAATANRLKEVHAALNDYSGGRESPFPLSACPWCGEPIRVENIKLVDDHGAVSKTKYTRAVVYCAGKDCRFSERDRPGQGLPVLFVDEQLYQELPDFLVATVDKFAMMPWRGEAGMLFGRATHLGELRAYGVMHDVPKGATPLPEGLLPPELVVQDELHLISGPLGTMVGLYESAVDVLSERGGRVPKVVCSTATVRRAREQIRALFHREMALFPPRGIDEGDNFFARPAAITDERPGRLYVGVGAPGRALRAVSVRTYATLLAAAQRWYEPGTKGHEAKEDQPADPYMTLVGYFNSLRELGGMRRLVQDEVRNRVAEFDRQKRPHELIGSHPWGASRDLKQPTELTSRVGGEELKTTKRRIALPYASKAEDVPDVVLASNMISVGLDVDRLGLMVVTGQPKTTSEYIQATSRVGRSRPGLVVTCLNVMRPRDRSHYERFVAYHESFYREVEATSVTPFSHQALDRGMVGTLVSMIRHGVEGMEPPGAANDLHAHRAEADRMVERLVKRALHHRQWHDKEAEERIESYVRTRGKSFLDSWEKVIAGARLETGKRTYSPLERGKNDGPALLFSATDEAPADHDAKQFEAPMSMRDVEGVSHVWVRFKPLDEK